MTAAVAATLLALAPAAADETGWRLRLGYDVYWRMVRVASMDSDTTVRPRVYRAAFALRTEGLVGALFPWTLRAESDGAIGDTGPRPDRHRGESVYRGDVWRTRIEYAAGAPVRVELEGPPVRAATRDEVPEALRADTVDPLTGTLDVLRAVALGQGCARTQHVFDGRLRYDLVYEDLGPAALEPSRRRPYAGPATLCRSTLRPIAGFRRGDRDVDDTVVTRSWIASPVPGASPVPVQLEMTGRRGTLHFYLRDTFLDP
jgi:hypothetical protein